MSEEPEFTPQEVAAIIGVTHHAVNAWCRDGIFRHARKTGPYPQSRWRIPLSDIKLHFPDRAHLLETSHD